LINENHLRYLEEDQLKASSHFVTNASFTPVILFIKQGPKFQIYKACKSLPAELTVTPPPTLSMLRVGTILMFTAGTVHFRGLENNLCLCFLMSLLAQGSSFHTSNQIHQLFVQTMNVL